MKYDFSGYASKNDVLCDDGRVIKANAFADMDGEVVTLVYGHDHKNLPNVVGHAMLENRPDGVYCYGTLNRETEGGKLALSLIKNGDIRSLSIYANKLKQKGREVVHGVIREVSLVISGANKGAKIDTVLAHGFDGENDTVVQIFAGDENPIIHSDAESEYEESLMHSSDNESAIEKDGEWLEHTVASMNDDQKEAMKIMMGLIAEQVEQSYQESSKQEEEPVKHSSLFSIFDSDDTLAHKSKEKDDEDEDKEESNDKKEDEEEDDLTESNGTEEVFVSDEIVEEELKKQKNITHSFEEGENAMKHNVFEPEYGTENGVVEIDQVQACKAIMTDAQKFGSLKDSFMAHSGDYGIDDIEMLFPNAKNYTQKPQFIKRRTEWVSVVIDGVRPSPFSRIKTIFADITEDDARAKGYIKGNRKMEEVFTLLKRETNPTTIIKKQKIDRDDVIDITEFDVIVFIKEEMRIMFDEEVARAILVGDGRATLSPDKIKEDCVRPIWKDDDLFTIKKAIAVTANTTDEARAESLITAIIKAHKQYRGSGKPTLFVSPDLLADMLLIKDGIKRPMYTSIDQLKNVLRVSDIVEVPIFEGLSRLDGNDTKYLAALMVNLNDYRTGRDKGGEINFFDDFDIDFNQQKYLMESRMSGALVLPYSAVAFEFVYGLMVDVQPEDPTAIAYGKSVSELQSNVFVNDTFIQGTLNYVTGYTGFSGVEAEQQGNYLALHFDFSEGATVKVKTIGGYNDDREPEITTVDPQLVVRVKSNREKLQVTTTLNSGTANEQTLVKVYSFSNLKLLAQ